MTHTACPILWTSQEAAIVTGGTSTQDWCATGIAIAMEDLKPGDLYIATQDDDLAAVFAKGAVAAVVTGSVDGRGSLPLLKVGDVFEALQALAGAARYRTHALIVSVQGRTARAVVHDILARAGRVHEGGRHLSLGMANLPDDVDFGLFGSSPAVRPDIAIITNCAGANRDTLFETMPVSGSVIINADEGEASLGVIARAKAAGIQNIFTYGRALSADACLASLVQADNGTRVCVNILGEAMTFVSNAREDFSPVALAGFLVLKLAQLDMPAAVCGNEDEVAAHRATGSVTLIDPALKNGPQALFKVTNMIDLGFGRQTAILDNMGFGAASAGYLAIPRRIATLDVLYTGKKAGTVANAQAALQDRHRNARIEPIATEVLAPGDFLVFKKAREGSKAIFAEALRLIPDLKGRKFRIRHAL